MWIRSQNQENYLDASGKTFSIYNGNQIRMKYANSSVLLGEYSSSKKAHTISPYFYYYFSTIFNFFQYF